MPDAYDNFATYAREIHKFHSVSPDVIPDRDSFYHNVYSNGSCTMSTAGAFSPSSSESVMDLDTLNLETLSPGELMKMITITGVTDCPAPGIKIVVQPVDKFRFRYKSEMMGTHGCLLGEREESSHKKEVPTVQLTNCSSVKNAVIRCTLVTADEERRFPHAHHLIRKHGSIDRDDPHDIEVTDSNDYTAMFCNMGIIHTAKKNIKEEIMRKRKLEILEEKRRKNCDPAIGLTTREDLELKNEAEKAQKWMNLNSVALCFQGFFYGVDNVLIPVTEKIYSRPINNLKSALTGELRICRIDKLRSSCEGNEEIWLLVEKVGRKNIKVKFYELDDRDNVIWDAEGKFSELDVHHQYAIVLRTPPYKDINITEPKEVLIRLERPSDGEFSNSMTFFYKPTDRALNRKRPRMSTSSGSLEFGQYPATQNPPLQNCVPMVSDTHSRLPCDNISDISAELKKLLSDPVHTPSMDPESRREISADSFLQEYLSTVNCSNFDQLSPMLGSSPGLLRIDGACSNDSPENDFAEESLQKAMTILKESKTTSESKRDAIAKARDLLSETTNYGDTPLHYCLRNDQYEIARRILRLLGADPSFKPIVNMKNSSSKTPLHLAVLQNKPDIVRALMTLDADPKLTDDEEASPLHSAVTVNACKCIDELLKYRSQLNLDAHSDSGSAALHLASKLGSLYAVQALVAAGCDINLTDMTFGRTALHIAVDNNHKHIVEYLLTKTKIDVNKINFGGNTALHCAVVKGGKCAEELVTILRKHGADPQIRNNTINRDNEEEDENSNLPEEQSSVSMDYSTAEPIIKSEDSSDSELDVPETGQSSFDLADGNPKILQLLNEKQPPPIVPVEELDLKEESEESEDEMSLQDRAIMQVRRALAEEQRQRHSAPAKISSTLYQKSQEKKTQQQQPQQKSEKGQAAVSGDQKLTDEHVERVMHILNRTGGWERLAQHTGHGSLIRLHKKTSNPSKALFVKIRLQQPDITVKQVEEYLRAVEAIEAIEALRGITR